jgi:hypothetical protein
MADVAAALETRAPRMLCRGLSTSGGGSAKTLAVAASPVSAGDLTRFAETFSDPADRALCRRPGSGRLADRQVAPGPARDQPEADIWASWIERGLVQITTVTWARGELLGPVRR